MASFNCFCSPWRRKKDKGEKDYITPADNDKSVTTLHVKLEHVQESSETTEFKSTSFNIPVPFILPGNSRCNVKVMNHESPVSAVTHEVDYEGGDEQDTTLSKRNTSDFDPNEEKYGTFEQMNSPLSLNLDDNTGNSKTEEQLEMIESGHLSDPGTKAEFWTSPQLKRSCSDLAMRSIFPEEPKSCNKIQRASKMLYKDEAFVGDWTSPVSVRSCCSADKVMLKKHSSSQILPSRSRRLWWKLFLWSHRNLHRVSTQKHFEPIEIQSSSALNQQGGYSSDIEPRKAMVRSCNEEEYVDEGNCNMDEFYGVSGMWPQNQWVAFNTDSSSPLSRVDEWVKEVSTQPPHQQDYDNQDKDDDILFPPSPTSLQRNFERSKEITHANTVVQSLNSSSTVAHITAIGLKVIPIISHFSSLRSVNLSGNFIVHITPGSLPKGLHTLNLSRNKINTIEGLRELTRLRELDLSYNKISRIGQGLSNCTLIKELYLAGNKISNVEGLHRLLKLNVLDLSFNKITTTKALGQLVANYNSLIALNLLGNPIQSNISDDLLRKTICSLLPKLALLNKQPINPQKAREIRADSIAKAALGNSNNNWNSRRKGLKRQGSSSGMRRNNVSAYQKSRQSSKNRSNRSPELKDKA